MRKVVLEGSLGIVLPKLFILQMKKLGLSIFAGRGHPPRSQTQSKCGEDRSQVLCPGSTQLAQTAKNTQSSAHSYVPPVIFNLQCGKKKERVRQHGNSDQSGRRAANSGQNFETPVLWASHLPGVISPGEEFLLLVTCTESSCTLSRHSGAWCARVPAHRARVWGSRLMVTCCSQNAAESSGRGTPPCPRGPPRQPDL